VGVGRAILLSLEGAEAGGDRPTVRKIIEVLAVLAISGVSRTLLARAMATDGDPDPEDTANRAIDGLVQSSVATLDVDKSAVTLHQLTRMVAIERARYDNTLAGSVQLAAHTLTTMTFPEFEGYSRRVDGEHLIAHIGALWELRRGMSGQPGRSIDRDILSLRRWATRQLIAAIESQRAVDLAIAVCTRLGKRVGD
jgi:hypothetical protein